MVQAICGMQRHMWRHTQSINTSCKQIIKITLTNCKLPNRVAEGVLSQFGLAYVVAMGIPSKSAYVVAYAAQGWDKNF